MKTQMQIDIRIWYKAQHGPVYISRVILYILEQPKLSYDICFLASCIQLSFLNDKKKL